MRVLAAAGLSVFVAVCANAQPTKPGPGAAPLPPTAAAPATPPSAPGSALRGRSTNKETAEGIERLGKIMGELEITLKGVTDALRDGNLNFEGAEQKIEGMLEATRRAMAAGAPDSELVKEARKSIANAESVEAEAIREGRQDTAKVARTNIEEMTTLLDQLKETHNGYDDLLNRLTASKKDMTLAERLENVEQMKEVLKQAVAAYQKTLEKALETYGRMRANSPAS